MTTFQHIVARVSRLKPGEKFTVDKRQIYEGWGNGMFEFLSDFKPPDRVLENVIGSSHTHRYQWVEGGDVLFQRLHTQLPQDVRSYVSPDRLDWFEKRPDGLYQHLESKLTGEDEARIRCALNGHRWEKAWVLPPLGPALLCPISEVMAEEAIQLVEGERCGSCRKEKKPVTTPARSPSP